MTQYCAATSERELAKYPGLVRRDGGVWSVRKRAPDDLRHTLGSSGIRRSLKTTDRKEAVGRCHAEMAKIAEGFKTARMHRATWLPETRAPERRQALSRLSLTRAIAKADAEGLPGLAPNTVGSYMQGLVAILRWATDADWGVKVNTRDLVETRKAQVKRWEYPCGLGYDQPVLTLSFEGSL